MIPITMMKEFTSNGVDLLIVQVPKDVYIQHNNEELWYSNNGKLTILPLPKGEYTFFCIAEEITLEQTEGIGFVQLTKDGHHYKWGIPDKDGWPGGYAENTGWAWKDFEENHRKAVKKLMVSIFGEKQDCKYVILKKV